MAFNDDYAIPEEEDLGTVILTMDDDSELECDIIAIFTANDREYIALLAQDDEEEDSILIYRFIDHGDDEAPELVNIDDDDEYDAAADALDELLDEAINQDAVFLFIILCQERDILAVVSGEYCNNITLEL